MDEQLLSWPLWAITVTALHLTSPTQPPPRQLGRFQPRQSQTCAYTCGSTCYWTSDVTAALDQAIQLQSNHQTLGEDQYPHEYYDDEGFDFPVAGPYYEFPILHDYQVYSGGSPGADRVVFNGQGDLAGLITHTGSSDDGFNECTKQ